MLGGFKDQVRTWTLSNGPAVPSVIHAFSILDGEHDDEKRSNEVEK